MRREEMNGSSLEIRPLYCIFDQTMTSSISSTRGYSHKQWHLSHSITERHRNRQSSLQVYAIRASATTVIISNLLNGDSYLRFFLLM